MPKKKKKEWFVPERCIVCVYMKLNYLKLQITECLIWDLMKSWPGLWQMLIHTPPPKWILWSVTSTRWTAAEFLDCCLFSRSNKKSKQGTFRQNFQSWNEECPQSRWDCFSISFVVVWFSGWFWVSDCVSFLCLGPNKFLDLFQTKDPPILLKLRDVKIYLR